MNTYSGQDDQSRGNAEDFVCNIVRQTDTAVIPVEVAEKSVFYSPNHPDERTKCDDLALRGSIVFRNRMKAAFGEKYILANIVVIPLGKPLDSNSSEECEFLARNKFLTYDIWQSFVYRKLYDLFRKNLIEHGKDIDPLYALNKEYHFNCAERPYLQMKYAFRDKTYRNNLNILFKEKAVNLHDSCIYVEISDQGRALYDKVEDRDRTILRLLKEVSELKRETTKIASDAKKPTFPSSKDLASETEEYHPEPVKKDVKNIHEEYVPVTRNGVLPGVKRIYKPSKIVEGGKSVNSSEPDPYTPETIETPVKLCYTPTTSPQNRAESQKKPPPKAAKEETSLFGSDDDEEYDPLNLKGSPERLTKNDSEKDMFSDNEQYSPSKVSSNEDVDHKSHPASSQELRDIFLKYKDKTERQWISSNELCYFTDVANILDEDQKIVMLQLLEDEFVPQQQRGKLLHYGIELLIKIQLGHIVRG
uniref:Uncharacterized protein n=1 Tax=Anopheles christyi TaxID=43041 RepID=A0A182JYX3_9DIPT